MRNLRSLSVRVMDGRPKWLALEPYGQRFSLAGKSKIDLEFDMDEMCGDGTDPDCEIAQFHLDAEDTLWVHADSFYAKVTIDGDVVLHVW